jgi:DNA mismatch repair protein MutS
VTTIEHGWSYPRPGSRLNLTGLFHPFLGQRAVPNDLELGEDVRICFVTGPNMAGKSTFSKAIATAVLLAHCGCGVPAAAMEFSGLRQSSRASTFVFWICWRLQVRPGRIADESCLLP